jgi:hypothetical protein
MFVRACVRAGRCFEAEWLGPAGCKKRERSHPDDLEEQHQVLQYHLEEPKDRQGP